MPARPPPAKVLIIDDDPGWLEIVRASLEKTGVMVACAERPEEAIEHLRADHYDLILLDWYLDGHEAPEVMPRIRGEAKGTPVWIVTGRERKDAEKDARSSGARGLLSKGVDLGVDMGFKLLSILAAAKRAAQQQHLDTLDQVKAYLSDAPSSSG